MPKCSPSSLELSYVSFPIRDAVAQHFKDIEHSEEMLDVTYENAQARERTQIIMGMANKVGGFKVGTGDLSEAALNEAPLTATTCRCIMSMSVCRKPWCATSSNGALAEIKKLKDLQ